ncbi:MAG: hypothetical protein RR090_03795 [Niameybacter sp.]
MFNRFLEWYETTMVQIFPYNFLVHFEEVALILAGIFIGILIMAAFGANFIRDLYSVDNHGIHAFRMVRVKEGKKTLYKVSFKSFSEAFQQLLLLGFSPIFTFKSYTERDEKRTKRFIVWMFILGVCMVAFAILSICTVFQSKF